MMSRKCLSLTLLSLIALQYVAIGVMGHGWLVEPVPRSGGTGTGTASTGGPCGQAGPTTVRVTWSAGQRVSVRYQRANAHGNTGNTVNLLLSYAAATATTPTTAHFTTNTSIPIATGALMDVGISGPQGINVTLPSNLTSGIAVLQWRWNPTSGGSWYDCAYVQIASANGGGGGGATTTVCSTNNGGCARNADCTGTTTASCTCRAGYFGNGLVCDQLPADVPMYVYVGGTSVNQDNFTAGFAAALGISPGRVVYDTASIMTYNTSRVDLSIVANPTTGESASGLATNFRNRVARGDTSLKAAVGYDVVSAQVVNVDTTPVTFGSDTNAGTESSSSSSNAGVVAGAIIGAIVGVALIVGLAVFLKKRSAGSSSSSSSSTSSRATQMTTPTSNPTASSYKRYAGNSSAWQMHRNDQGIAYYFNPSTGVSQWDRPADFTEA